MKRARGRRGRESERESRARGSRNEKENRARGSQNEKEKRARRQVSEEKRREISIHFRSKSNRGLRCLEVIDDEAEDGTCGC